MDKCFSKSVCNIFKTAEEEMLNCHHPYVGTEHLLLALLKTNKVSTICQKYNLYYDKFKEELIKIMGKASKKSEIILYTPLLNLVIDRAYNRAYDENKELDEIYLFSSLLDENDGIALRIIDNMNIDVKSIIKDLNRPKLIYELGESLNDKTVDRVYLRDKEINEVIEVLLRRNKNNPLLIGHSGVGKTAIVEELAQRIKEGKVPSKLKDYEIVMINTSTLVAGTKYRGEFESKVNALVKEVKRAKNIILFIDEVHTLVKTGASDGSIDAANILKPYLARGEIKVIGATTTNEYNQYIKKDPALARRFSTILVNEPSENDMKYILGKLKKNYENYYKLKIDKKCIDTLIKVAEENMPNSYNPDKCIELLDKACSRKILSNYNSKNKDNVLNKIDIIEVAKMHICDKQNKFLFNEIFNELKDRYHVNLVKNILNFLKEKNDAKKYMVLDGEDKHSKLKLLSFISDKIMVNKIVINCLDYNDEYSLSKFINNNYLYNKLEENPNSFIIFNNYNECNKVMYNLINCMIENGYITNNLNEKIYINNSYIFLLNNSGKNTLGFTSNNNLLFAS